MAHALAVGGNRAAVQLHKISYQRQPDSESSLVLARSGVGSPEAVEDAWQIRTRDADPGIGDFDDCLVIFAHGCDSDGRAGWAELDCVDEKIPQDLTHAGRIRQDDVGQSIVERQVNVTGARGVTDRIEHLSHESANSDFGPIELDFPPDNPRETPTRSNRRR